MTIVSNQNVTGYYRGHIIENIYNLKKEFIHGGHLLALGAPAVVLSITMLLRLPIRWEFLLLAYLFTICVYNFDHFKDLQKDATNNSERTQYLKNHQKLLPYIIFAYGCGFFILLLFYGTIGSIIFGIAFFIIALMYTIKFKNLTRKILGLKNIYTSFSMGLLFILITLLYSYQINWVVFVFFIFLFLRFFMNTSFCDIKDMESDKKQNLKTLPIFFGKQRFLLFLHALNVVSILFILFTSLIGVTPSFITLFLLLIFCYNFYVINKAKNPKANISFLTGVLMDGELILWPCILLIGSTLLI